MNVDFYFDFMSPYAYLAHHRVPAIAKKYGLVLNYHPIDLKHVKLAAGNTAPPTVHMPPKQRYSFADLTRWKNRYGVPVELPKMEPGASVSPEMFNSDRANIGAYFAIDAGCVEDYVRFVWGETWGKGRTIGSPDVLVDAASAMGWNHGEFMAFIDAPASRDRYTKGNQEAHARDVFGVPTLIVDKQLWWGNDRLDFFEEYLVEHVPLPA